MIFVPDSNGDDATGVKEFNANHVPGGSSKGGQFAAGKGTTQSAAFKTWFGQSKVVDAKGQPARMYHATTTDVKEFRAYSHFGTLEAANDRASTLTDFFDDTLHRSDRSQGMQIEPVYLSIEHPLRMPDLASIDSNTGEPLPDNWDDAGPDDDIKYPRGWEGEEAVGTTLLEMGIIDIDEFEAHGRDNIEAFRLLKTKGYDGIVYKNTVEDAGRDSWIIFNPRQVKSAIANQTFNRKSRKITEFNANHYPAGSAKGGQFAPGKGDVTRVGITSYRGGKANREVFTDMAGFATALRAIPGVSRVTVQPALGAWKGGAEPSWAVQYRGNGEATKLLARTGQRFNQDAVLILKGCRHDCSPVTEWVIDRPASPGTRHSVERVLAAAGAGGWTWYQRNGKPMVRWAYVPQWAGGKVASPADYVKARQRVSAIFAATGLSHRVRHKSARVEVLERDTYDTIIRG